MLTRPDYTASAQAVNDGDGEEDEYMWDVNFSLANMIGILFLHDEKVNKYCRNIEEPCRVCLVTQCNEGS